MNSDWNNRSLSIEGKKNSRARTKSGFRINSRAPYFSPLSLSLVPRPELYYSGDVRNMMIAFVGWENGYRWLLCCVVSCRVVSFSWNYHSLLDSVKFPVNFSDLSFRLCNFALLIAYLNKWNRLIWGTWRISHFFRLITPILPLKCTRKVAISSVNVGLDSSAWMVRNHL